MTTITTETPIQEKGAFPVEDLLAKELAIKPHQVWAAIRLLDGGATVPRPVRDAVA